MRINPITRRVAVAPRVCKSAAGMEGSSLASELRQSKRLDVLPALARYEDGQGKLFLLDEERRGLGGGDTGRLRGL